MLKTFHQGLRDGRRDVVFGPRKWPIKWYQEWFNPSYVEGYITGRAREHVRQIRIALGKDV